MLEANPNLNIWEIKNILARSANKEIVVPNPKPYCIKLLEKLEIFDNSNNIWDSWNTEWVENHAEKPHKFHNYYGFGLVDAAKAVAMSKNFKLYFRSRRTENLLIF
jgi:hypothetical protein